MTFSTKEMKSILTFSLLIGLLASCEKKEEEWGEIDDGVYEINQVIQFDFNSTKKVDVVDYTFRVTVSEKQKRIFFIVEQKNYDSEKTELYALEMQDEQGNILFTLDKIYNEKMEGNYDVTVLSDKRVSGSRIIKGEFKGLTNYILQDTKNVVATPIFKGGKIIQ